MAKRKARQARRRQGKPRVKAAPARKAPTRKSGVKRVRSGPPAVLAPVAAAPIEPRILLMRGQRVLLDSDLAQLYEVPTKRLNEQVRRNRARFQEDFLFELTADAKVDLIADLEQALSSI